MKYVNYDSLVANRSNIVGYYDSDIHGSRTIIMDDIEQPNPDCKIPIDAIEITDEQWQMSIDNPGVYWVNPNTMVFEETPPLPNAEILIINAEIKRNDIRTAYESSLIESVDVNGVIYHGGYESASKLDAAKRLAELATKSNVMFYDISNIGHDLSIADAVVVILTIGGTVQTLFTNKQMKMQAIDSVINDQIMSDDEKLIALDAIAW